MGWEADKRWSDKFLGEIKQICGLYLIGEAPIEEDQQRNTDLIVLKMEPLRIACRVRRNEFYGQRSNEITIRSGRPSGVKTELMKIISGWGNYMFYGFSNREETGLIAWKLCSLNCFRLWFGKELCKYESSPWNTEIKNSDGSIFRAFNTNRMPEDFIVASLPKITTIQTKEIFSTAVEV